jgi:hypothetical protein
MFLFPEGKAKTVEKSDIELLFSDREIFPSGKILVMTKIPFH